MATGGIADYIVEGGDGLAPEGAALAPMVAPATSAIAPAPAVAPATAAIAPTIGGNYRDYYYEDAAPMGSSQLLKILLLSMVIVVVIVVVAVVHLRRKARRFGRAIAADLVAASLAQQGWILYTRPGCPWCDRQMAALGGIYPAHIECTGDAAAVAAEVAKYPGAIACDDPKIVGFPFWLNTKTKDTRAGMQQLADLEKMIKPAAAGDTAAGAPTAAAGCPPPPPCPVDCAACATKEVCAACK